MLVEALVVVLVAVVVLVVLVVLLLVGLVVLVKALVVVLVAVVVLVVLVVLLREEGHLRLRRRVGLRDLHEGVRVRRAALLAAGEGGRALEGRKLRQVREQEAEGLGIRERDVLEGPAVRIRALRRLVVARVRALVIREPDLRQARDGPRADGLVALAARVTELAQDRHEGRPG